MNVTMEQVKLPNGRSVEVPNIEGSRIGAAFVLADRFYAQPSAIGNAIAGEVPREDRRHMTNAEFARYLSIAARVGSELTVGFLLVEMGEDA